MPDTAFQALKDACRRQIDWLHAQASAYEQGSARHIQTRAGTSQDVSADIAGEFRHQANNLQAVIDACERLRARDM
jgi:hypothetical protein